MCAVELRILGRQGSKMQEDFWGGDRTLHVYVCESFVKVYVHRNLREGGRGRSLLVCSRTSYERSVKL